MKIHIDIEASPQEVRRFFGLPDFEPMQRAWMSQLQDRIKQGMDAIDPAIAALSPAMTEQMKAFEAMQKAFWESFKPSSADADKKT